MFSFPHTESPSLSPFLSHTRARTHSRTLAHTHTHSHGVTRAHSHAHAQAEPLSCSLQFSGNEWGATQGTVVLANDLPGSHDAINVGWAGGWRLPRREPGSNVGSHARPASNYPGAQPRGLQEAASPPFAARSSGNRRGSGGGAGWGEVGVCVWGWGGENSKPPNKRAPGPPPQKQSPAAAGEPRGGAEGGGGGGEGLAQQALSRFIAIKWGPEPLCRRIRRRALSVMVEIPCGKLTPPRSQR